MNGGGRGFDSGALSGHHPARCGGELRPGGVRVSACNPRHTVFVNRIFTFRVLCAFLCTVFYYFLYDVLAEKRFPVLPVLVPILAPLKKLAASALASSLIKMPWSTGLNDGGGTKKKTNPGTATNLKKTQRTNLKISQR